MEKVKLRVLQALAFSITNLLLLWQGLLLSVQCLSQWAPSCVQFGERSTEVSPEPEYPWTPGSEITLDFSWWSNSWKKRINTSWWRITERKEKLTSDRWQRSKMVQGQGCGSEKSQGKKETDLIWTHKGMRASNLTNSGCPSMLYKLRLWDLLYVPSLWERKDPQPHNFFFKKI